MARVYVTRRIVGNDLSRLSDAGHEVVVWDGELPPAPELLRAEAAKSQALISMLTEQIDAALLDGAPGLKVVANYAVGYDNVDVHAAQRNGVAVGSTPDVLTDATADLAFALLLACSRRLPEASQAVRDGQWRTFETQRWLGTSLRDATLVIVGGSGRIGSAVARRAEGFEMDVVSVGRNDDLHDALARADFISLNVPLSEATRHLIDRDALGAVKPGAILVNTSRGGLVDEEALAWALDEGLISSAGLDVTDPEPISLDNPLLNRPNVIILPHIGSATFQARSTMTERSVDNVLAGLAGQPLPYPVPMDAAAPGGSSA